MTNATCPAMSVVIVTPDNLDTIRGTIASLQSQTVRDGLEVVIVAPSSAGINTDEFEGAGFFKVSLVEVASIECTAMARAEGIRHSLGPVVAFTEDHTRPEPGWAGALIETHRGRWAVVGPVLANANPSRALSRANFLIEYGQWLDPAPGGEAAHLPGHNSSYKRSVLLEYGDRLPKMLAAESVLHWDLSSKGHRLYLEPGARIRHLNVSLLGASIRLRFHGGRYFASSRADPWPALKRLVYAALSPLIPVVRLGRIVRELMKPGRKFDRFPATLPALLFLLSIDAAGEAAGYLFGAGGSPGKSSGLEFHHERHITEKERRLYTEIA